MCQTSLARQLMVNDFVKAKWGSNVWYNAQIIRGPDPRGMWKVKYRMDGVERWYSSNDLRFRKRIPMASGTMVRVNRNVTIERTNPGWSPPGWFLTSMAAMTLGDGTGIPENLILEAVPDEHVYVPESTVGAVHSYHPDIDVYWIVLQLHSDRPRFAPGYPILSWPPGVRGCMLPIFPIRSVDLLEAYPDHSSEARTRPLCVVCGNKSKWYCLGCVKSSGPRYCGKQCQKIHWKTHKNSCAKQHQTAKHWLNLPGSSRCPSSMVFQDTR